MNRQAELLKEAFSYQDSLTAYAYVVLQDWNLAEDVVQDLFVTVSVKWESFDSSKPLYPWLKRIVRNRAVDIIRSRSKEFYCADEVLLDLVESAFNQEDEESCRLRRSKLNTLLKQCIQQLNKASYQLVKRFYTERQSCAEIAAETNKSENAVYIALTRTRRELRRCASSKLSIEEGKV
jgi:RNA polymerase sigma factor (sigma-70 family)